MDAVRRAKNPPSQYVFSTPVEILEREESSFKPLESWNSLRNKIDQSLNHEYIGSTYVPESVLSAGIGGLQNTVFSNQVLCLIEEVNKTVWYTEFSLHFLSGREFLHLEKLVMRPN